MTKNEIVQPSKYEEAVPMNNDGKMFIFYCPSWENQVTTYTHV